MPSTEPSCMLHMANGDTYRVRGSQLEAMDHIEAPDDSRFRAFDIERQDGDRVNFKAERVTVRVHHIVAITNS